MVVGLGTSSNQPGWDRTPHYADTHYFSGKAFTDMPFGPQKHRKFHGCRTWYIFMPLFAPLKEHRIEIFMVVGLGTSSNLPGWDRSPHYADTHYFSGKTFPDMPFGPQNLHHRKNIESKFTWLKDLVHLQTCLAGTALHITQIPTTSQAVQQSKPSNAVWCLVLIHRMRTGWECAPHCATTHFLRPI
jgi:hypothetical protein